MKVFLITHDTQVSFGIGRYSGELYNRLKEKCDVSIIGNGGMRQYQDDLFNTPIQLFKKLANKDSIFHALSPRESIFLPLLTKKHVVTFHDILPLTNFHYPKSPIGKIYYKFIYNAAKKCSNFFADSIFTKNEMTEKLNIDEEKIKVLYLGISEKFIPIKKQERSDEFIVGYLGSMVKRKRVDIVIRSFKIFQEMYPKVKARLVIFGSQHNFMESFDPAKIVSDLKVPNVSIMGPAPEKDIVSIYNSFDAFLYPCDYDGWSLPILEAQRCGVPVITRKESMMPDEIKKFAIQASGEVEIARSIYRLFDDSIYKEKIIRDALLYSSRFTWDDYIKNLLTHYKRILES